MIKLIFISLMIIFSINSQAKSEDQKINLEKENVIIPKGMIAFFANAICPDGWSDIAELRGRFILGLPPSGETQATVGKPLANKERRRVLAAHTHAIAPIPGHSHQVAVTYGGDNGEIPQASSGYRLIPGDVNNPDKRTAIMTSTTSPSITPIMDSTGTADTEMLDAPYMQLLPCKKN
jgi:hypothetical protein